METQDNIIYVVSGGVRRGTSMVMEMLGAGGMELYYDTPEKPNEFNPHGYYEASYLKRLPQDPLWMDDVLGKAIKVFGRTLRYLPREVNGVPVDYRVIFMDRDPMASAISFQKMNPDLDVKQFVRNYKLIDRIVEGTLNGNENIKLIRVNYEDMLSDTRVQCRRIQELFAVDLNIDAMAKIPNTGLRHH